MTDIKKEDLIEKKEALTPEAQKAKEEAETKAAEKAKAEVDAQTIAEQDPLKTELERVQKSKFTAKERAEYQLKKAAERVKSVGGDPASLLGIEDETNDEDDKPLTLGMLKKIQEANASKTALQQADEISNETERELVKYHLQNTIKSTGNPTEDLKIARTLVNAVKNTQIIEETNRKSKAKSFSNASGVDAKDNEIRGELTEAEKLFMLKPFNLTKEQILKARTPSK